jgi:tetratricopeptide (TPR) repeat protein
VNKRVFGWLGPVALLVVAAAGVWHFVYREDPHVRVRRIVAEARVHLDYFEYQKAEQQVLEAIDILPEMSSLHHDLAIIYLRQGRLEDARAAFARAASLCGPDENEKRAAEYFQVAEIDVKQGRYEDAERALELGIAAAPTQRLLHTRIIDLQLGLLKRPARADTSTRRFLRLCQPTARNLFDAARLHFGRNSFLGAATLAREAALRADTMIVAHALVGASYWRAGYPDTGLAYIEGPLERYPEAAGLWLARGLLLIGAKRIDAALESLDRSLELRPNNYDAHRARMMAFYNAKRYEESLAEADVCFGLTDSEDEQRFLRAHVSRVRAIMDGTQTHRLGDEGGTPP